MHDKIKMRVASHVLKSTQSGRAILHIILLEVYQYRNKIYLVNIKHVTKYGVVSFGYAFLVSCACKTSPKRQRCMRACLYMTSLPSAQVRQYCVMLLSARLRVTLARLFIRWLAPLDCSRIRLAESVEGNNGQWSSVLNQRSDVSCNMIMFNSVIK